MNDREKINYYLKKRKEQKDKELKDWAIAFVIAILFFLVAFVIIGMV
ncbi:MAG TPA: hypothetical protein VFM82_12160 [Flavobacteriaceae bacterium]|nr:hypothetical protein [Flavobacteriaceae bacterium]